MPQPLTIENDALKLEVWPQHGGKVSSLRDKADGYELMFSFPGEIPAVSQYDINYSKSWFAGWDECVPSQAASKYIGHPYDGIAVPDHGELWGIPTTAVPAKNGITCVWNGLRFGYRFVRKLTLDGSALRADYTLVNLSPFDFRFVWAMHALLAMDVPIELSLPQPGAFRWSHDGAGNDLQRPFDWPDVQPGESLIHPSSLPAGKAWKVFSTEPIASTCVVKYPTRNRTLRISYASEQTPTAYWGVWVNTGGWAQHRHFVVTPTTGRYNQLDRSIRDGSAACASPLGRLDWSVRWEVGAIG